MHQNHGLFAFEITSTKILLARPHQTSSMTPRWSQKHHGQIKTVFLVTCEHLKKCSGIEEKMIHSGLTETGPLGWIGIMIPYIAPPLPTTSSCGGALDSLSIWLQHYYFDKKMCSGFVHSHSWVPYDQFGLAFGNQTWPARKIPEIVNIYIYNHI